MVDKFSDLIFAGLPGAKVVKYVTEVRDHQPAYSGWCKRVATISHCVQGADGWEQHWQSVIMDLFSCYAMIGQ